MKKKVVIIIISIIVVLAIAAALLIPYLIKKQIEKEKQALSRAVACLTIEYLRK